MPPFWIIWADSKSKGKHPYKSGAEDTERREATQGWVTDCSDAATSQGIGSRELPKTGRGKEGFTPKIFRRSADLLPT